MIKVIFSLKLTIPNIVRFYINIVEKYILIKVRNVWFKQIYKYKYFKPVGVLSSVN